ncbi:protein ripply1 [Arapaima gigas]
MDAPAVSETQAPLPAGPTSLSGWIVPDRTPARGGSHAILWRPWISTCLDVQRGSLRSAMACPYTRDVAPWSNLAGGKTHLFQHPVRLFWPKSKSFDYLYSDGEALLRNLPVQATISFYVESDSEDDDDEEDWGEEDHEGSGSYCKPHFTDYN